MDSPQEESMRYSEYTLPVEGDAQLPSEGYSKYTFPIQGDAQLPSGPNFDTHADHGDYDSPSFPPPPTSDEYLYNPNQGYPDQQGQPPPPTPPPGYSTSTPNQPPPPIAQESPVPPPNYSVSTTTPSRPLSSYPQESPITPPNYPVSTLNQAPPPSPWPLPSPRPPQPSLYGAQYQQPTTPASTPSTYNPQPPTPSSGYLHTARPFQNPDVAPVYPFQQPQQQPPPQRPQPPSTFTQNPSVSSSQPPSTFTQNPSVSSGTPQERWTTGIFCCLEDPVNCLITTCAPCITFGQIAEIVDDGYTNCATAGFMYLLILYCFGCPCIYSFGYRTKLRNKFNLEEAPLPDAIVHCFFEYCSLCQEYRELNNRGFDPALGWAGNIAKHQQQQQQAAMEPPVGQAMYR